jgi:hypothetical protein
LGNVLLLIRETATKLFPKKINIMKTYKLIANGRYTENEETVLDNINTIEELKNEIHNAATGYHCDFDSVAFASQEDEDDEPVIIFENLLYTGHNCECGIRAIKNDNTDVLGYVIDGDDSGTIYDDEDEALIALTNADLGGEISAAFELLKKM